MSFAKLKKNREDALAQLQKAVSNENQSGPGDDYWKPTKDEAGNGYAVIRFLPAADGDDAPFISYHDHWFQGPTGLYYIEKSRTTLGEPDPVSEYNSVLWNSEQKDAARKQKRRLHYVANIYVIKDSNKPENEGKVFKYRFGKKIFDKIKDAMNPEFEDEEPINPFDFWDGANFTVKVQTVPDSNGNKWPNYDKSKFEDPSPLFDGDEEKLKAVYEQLDPLSKLISPETFKSYDELKRELEKVLRISLDGEKEALKSVSRPIHDENEYEPKAPRKIVETNDEDDDEDPVSYFQRIADEE